MRTLSWTRKPGGAYLSPGETKSDVLQHEGSPWYEDVAVDLIEGKTSVLTVYFRTDCVPSYAAPSISIRYLLTPQEDSSVL